MCGRFTLVDLAEFTDLFPWIKGPGHVAPRYNIAPTQPVLAAACERGECRLEPMLWGLIPHWAKDRTIAARLINARSETAAQKPAFRESLRQRRAIVPASGFYEWKRQGKAKQPYYLTRRDRRVMLLAGLWDTWRDPSGQPLRSCTILTRQSVGDVAGLHERMPVILEPEAAEQWLRSSAEALDPGVLFAAGGNVSLTMSPVCKGVNVVSNDSPDLIAPAGSAGELWDACIRSRGL